MGLPQSLLVYGAHKIIPERGGVQPRIWEKLINFRCISMGNKAFSHSWDMTRVQCIIRAFVRILILKFKIIAKIKICQPLFRYFNEREFVFVILSLSSVSNLSFS